MIEENNPIPQTTTQQINQNSEQNMSIKNPIQETPTPELNKKTNLLIYIITIIISSSILVLFEGVWVLRINFLPISQTMIFLFVSIISLIIGLISGAILNKVAKTNKLFLTGNLIISILSGIIISIYLFIQKRVAEQIANLNDPLTNMFGPTPSPILIGILIIIFFNIKPLILFFKRKKTIK